MSSFVLHRRLTHSSTLSTVSRGGLHSMYWTNASSHSSFVCPYFHPEEKQNSRQQDFCYLLTPQSSEFELFFIFRFGLASCVPCTLCIPRGHDFNYLIKHPSSLYSSNVGRNLPKTYLVLEEVSVTSVSSPWIPSSPKTSSTSPAYWFKRILFKETEQRLQNWLRLSNISLSLNVFYILDKQIVPISHHVCSLLQ